MKKRKLIYGVGCNDVDYVVELKETVSYVDGKQKQRLVWQCPAHRDWKNMLERCYSEVYKQKHTTYEDSYCIEEWMRLSLFKGWRDSQGDVEGKCLDKDIIVPGNKLYSPDTCAYVWPLTNTFVVECNASRGEHPLGVCRNSHAGKFKAQCSNPFSKKQEHLGLFLNETAAHEEWRQRKHELAQLVAETESDPRVVEALKKRYSVEEWYKNNPM